MLVIYISILVSILILVLLSVKEKTDMDFNSEKILVPFNKAAVKIGKNPVFNKLIMQNLSL